MDESAGILSEAQFGSEIAITDLASANSNIRSELLPDGLQDALFSESTYDQFSLPESAPEPPPFSFDVGDSCGSVFNGCMLDTKSTPFRFSRSPRLTGFSWGGVSSNLDLVAGMDLLGDAEPTALDLALSESSSGATISPSVLLAGYSPGSGVPSPDSTVCTNASSLSPATGMSIQTTALARGKNLSDFNSPEEYFAYQDRRKKNNTASRRSRTRSKQKVRETEEEVQELRQENADLRKQLRIITEAFDNLRERLTDQPKSSDV